MNHDGRPHPSAPASAQATPNHNTRHAGSTSNSRSQAARANMLGRIGGAGSLNADARD
ncbi:hypothetical protein [Collimonas arenae]|nr:hypothetical protein [Collimonas arenae]